jgi:hypothetical protein
MYIHAKTVGWLGRQGAGAGGLTLRKGLYTGGFALAYTLMCGSVSVARWLDRFVYPAFELTPVIPPLFVIATPRSGTTFLHHLLALDDERFVSFKLYQTLAPSVLLDRALSTLRDLDAQAGLGLGRLLDAVDRRLFTAWNGIHRVGLRADEEDENLFVYSLVSPALYMLFPAILAIPELIDLSGFTPKTLRRLAHDYRETVRRLLYVTGGERTPLIYSRVAYRWRSWPSRTRATCTSSATHAKPSLPRSVFSTPCGKPIRRRSQQIRRPRGHSPRCSSSTTVCCATRHKNSLPRAGSRCASKHWWRIPWAP